MVNVLLSLHFHLLSWLDALAGTEAMIIEATNVLTEVPAWFFPDTFETHFSSL